MPRTRILLATVGSAGDLFPMLGLGAGLKDRGLDVTVVCASIYEDDVRAASLGFLPVGSEAGMRAVISDPDLWHPVRAFEVIARRAILPLMRPVFEQIARFDPAETLLIASGFAFGARLAQEKLGFRLLTAHLQTSLLLSAHDPAEMGGFRMPGWVPVSLRRGYSGAIERGFIDRILAPGLNDFRRELGLEPASRLFSRWMHSPDGLLGLFPDWFFPPQPDWPPRMALTGFIRHEQGSPMLPDAVQAFLDAGGAPLVFTAGSANVHGAAFFRTAIAAAGELGCRAILLTRHSESLPPYLPEGILHAQWLPLRTLLPRAALLVHHGGIGTTAEALAAGIPQLVTPLAHDQFDNANRLAALGVGTRLDPGKFNTRRALPVLRRLLGDAEVQERCRAVAARVDFEGAMEMTCDVVKLALE